MCKRALEVPDELMGKRVKCPGCKMIFTATPPGAAPPEDSSARRPRAGQQSEEAVRRRRPSPPPDDDEDEDEGEEEQPRVRKKPSRRREEEDEEQPRVRRKAARRIEEENEEDEEDEEEEDDRPRRRRRPLTGPRQRARSAVLPPAICLMVVGGLGIAIALLALAINLGVLSLLPDEDQNGEEVGKVRWVSSQARSIRGAITGICWGLAVLGGGIQMKNLKGFKSVMTSCILAMLPCNPCCLLGLPFGIWGLVAINRWDVKREFE
jgi:hypothetical protein